MHSRYGLVEEYNQDTNETMVRLVEIYFDGNGYAGYINTSFVAPDGVEGMVQLLQDATQMVRTYGVTPQEKFDNKSYP